MALRAANNKLHTTVMQEARDYGDALRSEGNAAEERLGHLAASMRALEEMRARRRRSTARHQFWDGITPRSSATLALTRRPVTRSPPTV